MNPFYTTLETPYFMLILKNMTENLEQKLVYFDEICQLYTYLCLHGTSFVMVENCPVMYGWREFVFVKTHLYFFHQKSLDYWYSLKLIARVGFFINISKNP